MSSSPPQPLGYLRKSYVRRPAASIFTKRVYEISYNSPNSVYLCGGLNVDGNSFVGMDDPNDLARDKLMQLMKEEVKTQEHENKANDEMLMIIRAGVKLCADEQTKSILQGPAPIPREPNRENAPPSKKMRMTRTAEDKKTKQNKKIKSTRYHY